MVVLWTARFAWAKGRNPWLWGAASAGLAFLPWHLAAMLPMVLLLFLRARAAQGEAPARPEGVTCPKCQTRHLASQHFCVNCGWDLAKPFGEPAAPQAAAPAPAPEAKPVTVASQATAGPAAAPPAATAQPPAPAPEQPQPAPKPPRVHRPPTAAGMTERGLALITQGKVQEAIDQFTKAIALDPGYLAAWQRRAEAYQRLGRPKEAAEDIRRLQALGGSAP
jgi:tetratricopeptide (TPR) repeat protein